MQICQLTLTWPAS